MFDLSSPQNRERLLLIVAGVIFVIVIIPVCYHLFGTEATRLRRNRDRLVQEIDRLETETAAKDRIQARLNQLTEQSLPASDMRIASLYQNWLISTAFEVGMKDYRVDPGSVTPVKNHYKKYTFTLHGRGTLGQISEFLRRFHRTNYLHLVRKVAPRPLKNSNEIDVSITVEALSLSQAKPSDSLKSISEQAIQITDDERKMIDDIVQRNLFAEYRPPNPEKQAGPVEKPASDLFDHSPYCYVTAIVETDGRYQVWIDIRTEGKTYKLQLNEMFRLGGVRCYIREISFDRVTIEAAGGFYTIKVGKSFVEYE